MNSDKQPGTFDLTGVDLPNKEVSVPIKKISQLKVSLGESQIVGKPSYAQTTTNKSQVQFQQYHENTSKSNQSNQPGKKTPNTTINKASTFHQNKQEMSSTVKNANAAASSKQNYFRTAQSSQQKGKKPSDGAEKLDTLKTVLGSIIKKNNDEVDRFALVREYESKIKENYNKLYEAQNNEKISKALKILEQKKCLKNELGNKQNQMEDQKKKYNMMVYETQCKYDYLVQLQREIEQVQSLFSSEAEQEKYYKLKDELEYLIHQVEFETVHLQSLSFMKDNRKKLVLFVRKKCQEHYDSINAMLTKTSSNDAKALQRRTQLKNLSCKYAYLIHQMDKKKPKDKDILKSLDAKMGSKFSEYLQDELSVFEETRAIKEIFEHEHEAEELKAKAIEEKKREDQLRVKQERDRQNDATKKERKKEENRLNQLRQDFGKISKVTSSKLDDITDHKQKFEEAKQAMANIEVRLTQQILQHKKEIDEVQNEIEVLKFQTEQHDSGDDDNAKNLDQIEIEFIDVNNQCLEEEAYRNKLEGIIDGVATIVSRILYQLQGKQQKQRNVDVAQKSLLNLLSVAGLKLEKMLIILSKKKKNFIVESINTDSTFKQTPDFLGLNPMKLQEDRPELFEDKSFSFDKEPLILFKDDENLDEEQKYVASQRTQIKKQINIEDKLKEDKMKMPRGVQRRIQTQSLV